jgi:hypothetical protein
VDPECKSNVTINVFLNSYPDTGSQTNADPDPGHSFVDPDPHGSAFIWIRIRTNNATPDPG